MEEDDHGHINEEDGDGDDDHIDEVFMAMFDTQEWRKTMQGDDDDDWLLCWW